MSHCNVYFRLFDAAVSAGVRLEDCDYWSLMPLLERQLLTTDSKHSPPLWWLVRMCDCIGADFQCILLGDGRALLAPVMREKVNRAWILQVRQFNEAADSDGCSYEERNALWEQWEQEQNSEAARVASVRGPGPQSLRFWQGRIKAYRDSSSKNSFASGSQLGTRPVVGIGTCQKHDGTFIGACPECGTSEYTDSLE